ncbi:hypothetical protein GCM10008949_30730 [Deinococcus humi]|nr:hypothetical protein GCM10008949_30730 [Deinococcus humi]
MRPRRTLPGRFLYLNAGPLSALAEKYGGRPSEYVELRRALPLDCVVFDQAVMLWAGADAVLDTLHARKMAESKR